MKGGKTGKDKYRYFSKLLSSKVLMYHTWCTIDFVDCPCAAHGRCDVRYRPNFGLFYLTMNLGQNIGLYYLMQHGLAQGLATTLRPMLSPLYHLYMLLSSICGILYNLHKKYILLYARRKDMSISFLSLLLQASIFHVHQHAEILQVPTPFPKVIYILQVF